MSTTTETAQTRGKRTVTEREDLDMSNLQAQLVEMQAQLAASQQRIQEVTADAERAKAQALEAANAEELASGQFSIDDVIDSLNNAFAPAAKDGKTVSPTLPLGMPASNEFKAVVQARLEICKYYMKEVLRVEGKPLTYTNLLRLAFKGGKESLKFYKEFLRKMNKDGNQKTAKQVFESDSVTQDDFLGTITKLANNAYHCDMSWIGKGFANAKDQPFCTVQVMGSVSKPLSQILLDIAADMDKA